LAALPVAVTAVESFAATAYVSRVVYAGGDRVDCAERSQRCELVVRDNLRSVHLQLSFDAVPRVEASISLTPDPPFDDGDSVTVDAHDLPALGYASIAMCVAGFEVGMAIPADGVQCVAFGMVWQRRLGAAGSQTSLTTRVERLLPASDVYGLPEADCAEHAGRCDLLLIINETVVARHPMRFAAN
jgi:hypothetical protein